MMDDDAPKAGRDEREAEDTDDAYPPGVPPSRELPDIADVSEPGVISAEEVYEGELAAEGGLIDADTQPDALLDLDLRPGETDDPTVAAEEGLAWVPPSDPPVVGVEPDGDPLVAAGFGTTALDEPYDADHHSAALLDQEEVTARVREALRADAATAAHADRIAIAVVGETAVLTGTVDDLDDVDDVLSVAQRATGLSEIVDRLGVAALDASSRDPRARDAD